MKEFLKIIAVAVVCIIAGAYLQECQRQKSSKCDPPDRGVTDTATFVDTIPYLLPVPAKETTIGTKVIFLRTPTFPIDTDSVKNIPEICNIECVNIPPDSLLAVEIPITQKEYEGEEYHAWVSGYEPSLDSIFVFPRHDVVTIREPPDKPKRWGIGVFAGYGMTPHGLQPCAGISVSYNLWNF